MTLEEFLDNFISGNTMFSIFIEIDDEPHEIVPPTTYWNFNYTKYQHILERQVFRLITLDSSPISIIVDWK